MIIKILKIILFYFLLCKHKQYSGVALSFKIIGVMDDNRSFSLRGYSFL